MAESGNIQVCIYCGYKGAWQKARELPAFLFGRSFTVLRCPRCGIGRTWPVPKLEKTYYSENEDYGVLFKQKQDLYIRFAQKLLSALVDRMDIVGKRLLDIGCGGGFVVESAGKMGFIAEGIETNRGMVAWCQERGLNVREADVVQMEGLVADKYDVIVLSAVLEHLENPVFLLEQIKAGLLKADGLVLISQASYDGMLPVLFPWGWYGWQPQEHFWHFTPVSFRRLADKAGFEVVHLTRSTLYHPWVLKGSVREIAGRNLAAIIGRMGVLLGHGDNFRAVLQPRQASLTGSYI